MSVEPHIHFLGHSTLRIELEGVRILTDPCLRDHIGPLVRHGRVPEPHDYRGCDLVLISHLHHDHLDVPSLRLLTGRPTLVVPRGSEPLMARSHLHRYLEVVPGEAIRFGGITIRVVHAEHAGDRPPHGPQAVAVGYLIEGETHRLYFAGDTDIFPAMAELGAPDIAFIPVWGWGPTLGKGHLDPSRAAEALRLIRPRIAVPIHWGTFWPRGLTMVRSGRRTGPAAEFREHAATTAPETVVVVTPPGETVRSPDLTTVPG